MQRLGTCGVVIALLDPSASGPEPPNDVKRRYPEHGQVVALTNERDKVWQHIDG
jgi:hypothetical protein